MKEGKKHLEEKSEGGEGEKRKLSRGMIELREKSDGAKNDFEQSPKISKLMTQEMMQFMTQVDSGRWTVDSDNILRTRFSSKMNSFGDKSTTVQQLCSEISTNQRSRPSKSYGLTHDKQSEWKERERGLTYE